MKQVLTLLCTFLFTGMVSSQNSHVQVKNNTHMDLMYGFEVLHGLTAGLPGIIKDGQVMDFYFNPGILSGSEGYINIYPLNQQNNRAIIYYDNPFIGQAIYSTISSNLLLCKTTKWDIINNGNDCELTVEITNPGSNYGKPVSIVTNNNATIKGSVTWNINDIQGPETNPYGNAFIFSVKAPTAFIESNGPFLLEKAGTYNGKNGYFEAFKEAGSATYETVNNNNGTVEIKYTITGVPSGVPLQLDVITDYTKSKWAAGLQKPKPANDYVFIVGTFPSGQTNSITINNNPPQIGGVDFTCDGEWRQVDANGNLTGAAGNMVNKIAGRKNNAVLPGNGMIAFAKTETQSNQLIQAPAAQNKTQQVQVQKVRTVGAIKIKQQ